MLSAEHILAAHAGEPLGFSVHISQAPVAIERHETIGDAFENRGHLVAGELGLGAKRGLAFRSPSPRTRHLQMCTHARAKLAGGKWLHQIIVGAGFQAFDAHLLACARREKNDGQRMRARSARTARRRSKPSNTGIMMSLSNRSGGFSRIASSGLVPVSRGDHLKIRTRIRVTWSRISALSSANRTRGLDPAVDFRHGVRRYAAAKSRPRP